MTNGCRSGPARQSGSGRFRTWHGSACSQLTGFIGPELRPDLTGSAYSGESPITDDDVTALRAELQRQVDEATAAKAELDAPYT